MQIRRRPRDGIFVGADLLGMFACYFPASSGVPLFEYPYAGLPFPLDAVSSSEMSTRPASRKRSRFSKLSIVCLFTREGPAKSALVPYYLVVSFRHRS